MVKPITSSQTLTVRSGNGPSFHLRPNYAPYATEPEQAKDWLPDPDAKGKLVPVVHLYTATINDAEPVLLNRLYTAAAEMTGKIRPSSVIILGHTKPNKDITSLILGSSDINSLSNFIANHAGTNPHLLRQNMEAALQQKGVMPAARRAG